MTDKIEAEAFARARYESGRPMMSGHFDDPPDPTMRGTVADRPVVELVLALVDDDGRVDGDPLRIRVAMCYDDGDFAEGVLEGATTLREALTRLLGSLTDGRASRPRRAVVPRPAASPAAGALGPAARRS